MSEDARAGVYADNNYMNIIRDSSHVTKKREDLEKQKRDILNMTFTTSKRRSPSSTAQLNKFMSDRHSAENSAF